MNEGKPIVLTAPLTETIDNPGYFIQMGLASMPGWMEWAINYQYPNWKKVDHLPDGSAIVAPCGLRVLQQVMEREFGRDSVVVCYPQDLSRFIGPATKVVAVSTHNPLGTTFAAGVYASIFGSSKDPINSIYTKDLFQTLKGNPFRPNFKVIVGGSGSWQVSETDAFEALGIDCAINGRAESVQTVEVFRKALAGQALPREIVVSHPHGADEILVPTTRTTFGVVEMTTGCGRRCSFCLPDLNPQISIPKERILGAVHGNVNQGNSQISLATEDMFVWNAAANGTPFFFPNREALIDLYRSIASVPGVKHILLSHCTIAPAVVDPQLIRELSAILLEKSPIRIPAVSSHPEGRILSPLIGVETGSVRMAKKIMAGKSLPFDIKYWPSIVLEGLRTLNSNNWFPVMTLIVGAPDETDEDTQQTLDLLHEMERRGLYAFLVPSIFTPLRKTRMAKATGVERTQQLSTLQWQLIMKAWRMTAKIGLNTLWTRFAWSIGSIVFWALRGRRLNGKRFTWPLMLFSGAVPDRALYSVGKLYEGKPLKTLTRQELIDTIKPEWSRYVR